MFVKNKYKNPERRQIHTFTFQLVRDLDLDGVLDKP